MERPTLDSLFLTDDELRTAGELVQQMAYFKWLDAGRPEGHHCNHWCDAELEWIEYFYVQNRFEVEQQSGTREQHGARQQ